MVIKKYEDFPDTAFVDIRDEENKIDYIAKILKDELGKIVLIFVETLDKVEVSDKTIIDNVISIIVKREKRNVNSKS